MAVRSLLAALSHSAGIRPSYRCRGNLQVTAGYRAPSDHGTRTPPYFDRLHTVTALLDCAVHLVTCEQLFAILVPAGGLPTRELPDVRL
jgi:hypothetical protein